MRGGIVTVGALILVFTALVAGAGATLQTFADACPRADCRDEALAMDAFGRGLLVTGGILGLVGVGVLVGGIVSEKPPKRVEVPLRAPPEPTATTPPPSLPVAAAMRACPACEAQTPAGSKRCVACGAAIAPVRAA